jgi:hypothetical protein
VFDRDFSRSSWSAVGTGDPGFPSANCYKRLSNDWALSKINSHQKPIITKSINNFHADLGCGNRTQAEAKSSKIVPAKLLRVIRNPVKILPLRQSVKRLIAAGAGCGVGCGKPQGLLPNPVETVLRSAQKKRAGSAAKREIG